MKRLALILVVGLAFCVGAIAQNEQKEVKRPADRITWQYKILSAADVADAAGVQPAKDFIIKEWARNAEISENQVTGLNKLAEQGWELVSVVGTVPAGVIEEDRRVYYLKKPK